MNWKHIQDNYPKAWVGYIGEYVEAKPDKDGKWYLEHKSVNVGRHYLGNGRDLYGHFDELGICCTVRMEVRNGMKLHEAMDDVRGPVATPIYTAIVEMVELDSPQKALRQFGFKSRYEAEDVAFTKAFEIREAQL